MPCPLLKQAKIDDNIAVFEMEHIMQDNTENAASRDEERAKTEELLQIYKLTQERVNANLARKMAQFTTPSLPTSSMSLKR